MLDPEAFGDFDACRRASLCHCVFIVQVLIWILNVKINVYAYLGTDDMSGGGGRVEDVLQVTPHTVCTPKPKQHITNNC